MNKAEWIRGKTVEQITNMPLKELEKLTESQLRTLVGRLVSAGNKRMRRMEAKYSKGGKGAGQFTFIQGGQMGTYQQLKFSTTGKDKESLLQEFKRARSFMKSETSSLAGQKRIRTKSLKGLRNAGIDIGDLSANNYDRFWKAYEKLKELHPEISEKNFKYVILDKMSSLVEGKKTINIKSLIREMEQKLQDIYEENQRLANADGTSGFFDVQY